MLSLQEFNRQADIAVNLQARLLHMVAVRLHCLPAMPGPESVPAALRRCAMCIAWLAACPQLIPDTQTSSSPVPSLQATNSSVPEPARDVILTGDIGGTNCRFTLWAANVGDDVDYEEIFSKARRGDSTGHKVCCELHGAVVICSRGSLKEVSVGDSSQWGWAWLGGHPLACCERCPGPCPF